MKSYTAKEIEAILETSIKRGDYKPNDKLPSERELMETYHVSRTTIRTIISQLHLKRLVYRVPDKGVYVEKEIIRKASRVTGFTEMVRDTNRTPSTEVVFFDFVPCDDVVAEKMGLHENDNVVKLVRKRLVDNEPFLIETVYIHPSFEAILDHDMEKNSLYDIIDKYYHKNIYYMNELVSAVTVDGDISQFLYQKNKGFALRVEGVSYSYSDEVIQYGISHYHAERFSFESTILNQL